MTERAGVLETSIDESMTYEPDRTMDDSSEEDEEDNANKPDLDEQVRFIALHSLFNHLIPCCHRQCVWF